MRRKRTDNLVSQYLENISRKALEEYQGIIKKYVRGRHGVYALYRRNKLYYVGLASNLRSRLRHHLRDRHALTWDRFSIYLTVGGQHLHELETLVLRIVKPKGNLQRGKFPGADDLRKIFRRDIAAAHDLVLEQLFCADRATARLAAGKVQREKKVKGRKPTLAPYVTRRFYIRFNYKGLLYIAHVRRDGSIKFAAESAEAERLKGEVFTSPSLAGRAVTKRATDGWYVWKFERAPGDWVVLNELRK